MRHACRDAFYSQHVLARLVPDLDRTLDVAATLGELADLDFDGDDALPGGLWDPERPVRGGVNHADLDLES